MAAVVYILCALTAIACMLLLLRGWRRSGHRLLLWSGLCFAVLALNNVLLFVDLIILPSSIDLQVPRSLTALIGIGILIFGLLWDGSDRT